MSRRRGVRSRRGFIIIWGWRTLERGDGRPTVETTCPGCRQTAVLRGRFAQRWFTLMFIPVCPLEKRDDCVRFTQCTGCRGNFTPTIETFARRAGALVANDHATAIKLYNELRDRPDDGATLLRLLGVYEAMGERREAESSCRAYPKAFASEPRCAEVMARIADAG